MYVKAYRHVVDLFRREKAENVRWVWTPWKDLTMEDYYPGNEYVDIIGINLLNYGQAASDGLWHSFATLYEPFRFRISRSKCEGIQTKPVMISEFGTTRLGGDQSEWMEEALFRIAEMYSEIKYLVFFESGADKNWPGEWRPDSGDAFLDWRISDQPQTRKALKEFLAKPPYSNFTLEEKK
jgi:beta-mannanase